MTRLPIGLAAAAASLCVSMPVEAQKVQIYGLFDMSIGRVEAPGADAVWRADSGRMSESFIGVQGSDDLGGGLSARFAIEHYLRVDAGAAGRFGGDAFWGRTAHVGLSGAFGTSLLGRNLTPLYASTVLFNAFGDSFGFSPSIRHLFAPSLVPFYGDVAWNNSLAYTSNRDDGVTIRVIGNLGEAAAGATGKNTGAHLLYEAGPLAATAAWQRVRNGMTGTPPGFASQRTWQLGVSYDLTLAKLYGQYTRVKTNATTATQSALWSFGASVPLGPGSLLAQYGDTTAKTPTEAAHKTLSLGYALGLSKRSDAYAVYMNDKVQGLDNADSFAAGVRLRF